MSSLPISLQAFIAALFGGLIYWFSSKLRDPLRNLPSPEQGPLYKRLLVEPSSYDCERWMRSIPNDGLIRYCGIMGAQRLLVTTPGGVKDILQREPYKFEKPKVHSRLYQKILGNGLVTVEGQSHKNQRKLLQHAFKMQHIRESYSDFWQKTLEFVDSLDGITARVNIVPFLSRPALDNVAKAGFGFDFQSVTEPDNELSRNYATGFFSIDKSAQRRRLLAFILPFWLLNLLPLKRNTEMANALRAIRQAIGKLLVAKQKKIAQREDKKENEHHEEAKSILGVLMASNVSLDMKTMIDQCMTFLGAGQETTAAALSWAVFEVSRSNVLQKRIRQEVRSIVPPPSPSPSSPEHCMETMTTATLEKLKFTSAVINEVLRLHSPLFMIPRVAVAEVNVAGRSFPKDTEFRMSIWALHRSVDQWGPRASIFDPDRWINNHARNEPISTFGHGPRQCIGEKLARTEMVMLLAALVARYDMEFLGFGPKPSSSGGIRIELSVANKIEEGLFVKLKRVDGW